MGKRRYRAMAGLGIAPRQDRFRESLFRRSWALSDLVSQTQSGNVQVFRSDRCTQQCQVSPDLCPEQSGGNPSFTILSTSFVDWAKLQEMKVLPLSRRRQLLDISTGHLSSNTAAIDIALNSTERTRLSRGLLFFSAFGIDFQWSRATFNNFRTNYDFFHTLEAWKIEHRI